MRHWHGPARSARTSLTRLPPALARSTWRIMSTRPSSRSPPRASSRGARSLKGRVVVLDVAFASGGRPSGGLRRSSPSPSSSSSAPGSRLGRPPRPRHARRSTRRDPRFVLATKAEHGACPEMVTPELVERIGPVDTIVCHTDFDGLCSAAKWLRGGRRALPRRRRRRARDRHAHGTPGPSASASTARSARRPRDTALFGLVVRHLAGGLADASLWETIDHAAAELDAIERVDANGRAPLPDHRSREARRRPGAFGRVRGRDGRAWSVRQSSSRALALAMLKPRQS